LLLAGACVAFLGLPGEGECSSSPGQLAFERRLEAQRAIEQVYWNHRLWPSTNPQPKPPLSAVMTDEALGAKVEDYLRKSNALATLWGRPVSATQLQAEVARMVRQSQDGQVLAELFAALDDDPFVIAETLARQHLVRPRWQGGRG
jgi:hypothetical protein